MMACLLAAGLAAAAPAEAFTLESAGAQQVVLVVTPGWGARTGVLRRFVRAEDGFAQVGGEVPVSVGWGGMGWGIGLHPPAGHGPHKRGGDGRAPAGVFRLGDAMGYAAAPPAGSRMRYRQSTSTWRCVTDPRSSYYNRVVDQRRVPEQRPWRLAEVMRREDHLYRFVVRVEHNAGEQTVAGGGACIFLHVWRRPRSATAGCTAMDAHDVEQLVRWLDPQARPVLVQLPRGEYERLRAVWVLP